MLGGVTAAEAKSSKSAKYDLVIVGAGCGGLVCAIHAAELGLKPLLLEKMPMPAGNAIYAAGFLLGLNTSFQKAKNVPADTAEAFYDDMMKVSQQKAVPALTHTVVDNCTRLLEWLHSFCGINFLTGNKLVWPQLYRSHLVTGELKPGGAQLVMTLLNKAKAMGVEVRTNTKVVELIADPKTGGVAGAKVKTKGVVSEVYAKYGVVLATGGFSANQALVTQYIGSAGAKMPIRGSRIVAGENIVLTAPFLPKVVNVDQFHCGPIVGITHVNPADVLNSGYGVQVNTSGKRFMDENNTYVVKARTTALQTLDNQAWVIVDSECPVLDKVIAKFDRLHSPYGKADTIEELCKQVNLPEKNVVKEVKAYNDALAAGKLEEMVPPCTYKKPHPVAKAPFYAVPFQGGMTATFGGPLINTKAEIQSLDGGSIPGLYAAGNAAGGIFFFNYAGGAQLGAATVYGRIAGRELANRAKQN